MRILVISGSKAQLPDPVYPLGAAIVGTLARRAGHDVRWFDALRHKDAPAVLADTIALFAPELVLMSVRNIDSSAFPSPVLYFDDHKALVDVCRRETGAPLIIGGSGVSLMPDAFAKHLCPDYAVVGEGEGIIPLLLVKELNRRDSPEIIRAASPIEFHLKPDRDLFDATWYYEKGGVANLQTKRGCPFRCIYCTYPLLEGPASRLVDPRDVVDEIAAIAAMGIRHFFFVDAVFNAPESHAAAICEEIIRRNLDISFTAYFAPTSNLPEFFDLLSRAGCSAAELGTDSLDDGMLESYQKGFTAAEVLAFSRHLKEHEIPQCHNLILGGPGETPQTMETSVATLDEIDPTAVILTIGLRVYPGTELAARCSTDGGVGSGDQLEPVFYIEEAVADTIVEKSSAWVDARRGWICPGLGKRYNPRYLQRLRLHRNRKGVLWPMF